MLSARYITLENKSPVTKITFSSRDPMSFSGLNFTNCSRLGIPKIGLERRKENEDWVCGCWQLMVFVYKKLNTWS
jgi:hypothetical protein